MTFAVPFVQKRSNEEDPVIDTWASDYYRSNDTNVKGIAQPAFSIYQGLFETPRGILVVPRAKETATEDGLAIFDGTAVPLDVFAVDETEPSTAWKNNISILKIFIRRTRGGGKCVAEFEENGALVLEPPLAAALARTDARVPRTPRTPLPLRAGALSLFSR